MNIFKHDSVLLEEACSYLVTNASGIYVDGTFGRGGHSNKILQTLSRKGKLIGIDKDPVAVDFGNNLAKQDIRFKMVHGSFVDIDNYLTLLGINKVNGLLLDLGVSSPQLDDATRGFSFMRSGKLDMRMNPQVGISASDWLSGASEQEITKVFRDYGQERYAKRLAKAIIDRREIKEFIDTADLAEVIKQAHPAWVKGKHPATKAFQALRIQVNNELEDLQNVLSKILDLLVIGGRLVVISFHSLEDKLVKQFITLHTKGNQNLPRRLPVITNKFMPKVRFIGKYKSSLEQVKANPRARSAIMRIAEKIA